MELEIKKQYKDFLDEAITNVLLDSPDLDSAARRLRTDRETLMKEINRYDKGYLVYVDK